VTTAAEAAVFLGQRSAIFKTETNGSVTTVAFVGRPTRLGGVIASLGTPVVDDAGGIYFGAELQRALFNEALLTWAGGELDTYISPDARLLRGGGIAEFFPTRVDDLGVPAGAVRGVAFTATLLGSRTPEAVFLARRRARARAIVRVGSRISGKRVRHLGTPATWRRGFSAVLADVGGSKPRLAVARERRGVMDLVAQVGSSTRARGQGVFTQLSPPDVGAPGVVFHATVDDGREGIFVVGSRGRRTGLLVANGDVDNDGAKLRSPRDPIVVGDHVWFLARTGARVAPPGLYRVKVDAPPGPDEVLPVEAVLRPGDVLPGDIGGVVVRMDRPRVGPTGIVSVVVTIGGGRASSALLEFDEIGSQSPVEIQ
jgi:hypothetical protein